MSQSTGDKTDGDDGDLKAERVKADRLFEERVTRYLADVATADELTWLNRELAARPARRERFVQLCLVESMVAEEFSPQSADAGVAAGRSPGSSEWSGLAALSDGTTEPENWTDRPLAQRFRIDGRTLTKRAMKWAGLAVAAAVLIAVSGGWPRLRGPVSVAVAPPDTEPANTGPANTGPAKVEPVSPAPKSVVPATAPANDVALPTAAVAVASITHSRDAVWTGGPIAAGAPLRPGAALGLASGVAELTFTGGTAVVLEGPAAVTIDSASLLTLSAGKAFATARGGHFAVATGDAVVTDLGTEFGVSVPRGGGTRVEVFRGSVRLQSRAMDADPPLTVMAGDAAFAPAAAIAEPGQTPSPRHRLLAEVGGAAVQHFVRTLDRPAARAMAIEIDVVDLFAGGDGRGHRRGRGLDVLTGTADVTPIGSFVGKHSYQRAKDLPTADLPAIDGGFVPDQNGGPTTIDSLGRTFEFPKTDNHSFARIWAGGPVPSLAGYPARPSTLGGVDYATTGHGLLAIDSNKGVTLDLNALRRAYPLLSPTRLRCGVGNSCNVARKVPPRADVFVIVDGKSRFERRGVTPSDGLVGVDITIGPEDRFLTIVTTDGGDGVGYDWVLWTDPLITLSASR